MAQSTSCKPNIKMVSISQFQVMCISSLVSWVLHVQLELLLVTWEWCFVQVKLFRFAARFGFDLLAAVGYHLISLFWQTANWKHLLIVFIIFISSCYLIRILQSRQRRSSRSLRSLPLTHLLEIQILASVRVILQATETLQGAAEIHQAATETRSLRSSRSQWNWVRFPTKQPGKINLSVRIPTSWW